MAKNRIPEPGNPIQLGEFFLEDRRFPAVYFLYDDGDVVYVGQTKTLKWRIEQHLQEGVKTFDAVAFAPCCVSRLLEVEAHYIRELVPTYNQCLIAEQARREASYIPDGPRLRMVDGEPCLGSLGLSQMMGCSRPFAKQLIAMTGKEVVTFADALWMAAFVREPKEETVNPNAGMKRACRHRNAA